MGKFTVKANKQGFNFNLKATNGQIICTSETYKSERTLNKGIASVVKNAPIAPVEDQTVEEVVKQKCPKFELYVDKGGKYRFRLKATNGQIIAASQGYKSLKSALNGIDSIKKNVVDAPIEKEE